MSRFTAVLCLVVATTLAVPALAQDSPADAPASASASTPAAAPTTAPADAKKADAKAEEKAADPAPAVTGANLKVGSMTVNGFTVSDLSCRLEGGGFLASATVVGGLAAQKGAIQKCGKTGDKVHVLWDLAGGKSTNIKVTGGSAKAQKCVGKAMKKVKVGIPGQCGGYFHLGK